MRQARIDAQVRWPRDASPDDQGRSARRNGLLALVTAMALGAVYVRYAGSVALDPAVVTFPEVTVGATPASASVTLKSEGLRAVKLGPVAIEGEDAAVFQVTENACLSIPLEPGTSCSIVLAFAPLSPGLHAAWLSVFDEASPEPRRVALVGMGQPPETGQAVVAPTGPPPVKVTGATPPRPAGLAAMRVIPVSLTFGRQPMGSSSPAKPVTILSSGSAPMQVGSVRLRGDTGDFLVDGKACEGQQLAPSKTCEVNVSFSPRAGRRGDRLARLVILEQASARRHEVELTGSADRAVAAPAEMAVTPPALVFADQDVGGRSAPSVFSVANASKAPMGPVDVALGDTTNFAMGTNKCAGSTLQPGGACEFEVLFSPTDSRMLYGTLDIKASGQRQLVIISGKGVDPGWCCVSQRVVQLNALACRSQDGKHFATRKAAETACAPPAQPVIR